MKIVVGNLLDAEEQFIGHGCNAQGVMGSGVALAIKNKWPKAFESYKEFISKKVEIIQELFPDEEFNTFQSILGDYDIAEVAPNKFVVNIFTQNLFGHDKGKYARYIAIVIALDRFCEVNPGVKLALPYKFASDRGGLDWDRVEDLLRELEERHPTNEFVIYKLEQ